MEQFFLRLGGCMDDGGQIQEGEYILMESNRDVSEVREAYKRACFKTGLFLHEWPASAQDCGDYVGTETFTEPTATKRNSRRQAAFEKKNSLFCAFSENSNYLDDPKMIKRILDLGLPFRREWVCEEHRHPRFRWYAELWIAFVKLGNPLLEINLSRMYTDVPLFNNSTIPMGFACGL